MDGWITVGTVASCIAAIGTTAGLFIAWWTSPPKGLWVTSIRDKETRSHYTVIVRPLGAMILHDPELHIIGATLTGFVNHSGVIDATRSLRVAVTVQDEATARVEIHWVAATRTQPTRQALRLDLASGQQHLWKPRWYAPWAYRWVPYQWQLRGGLPGARD